MWTLTHLSRLHPSSDTAETNVENGIRTGVIAGIAVGRAAPCITASPIFDRSEPLPFVPSFSEYSHLLFTEGEDLALESKTCWTVLA
jgi:hypothetical protein